MSYVDKNGLQEYSTKLWNKIKLKLGSPLTAATAAAMTDTDRVYIYTGSETGYNSGHWYYFDGSSWADGGVYNAVAVNTDTNLNASGVPADGKVTGNKIGELKGSMDKSLFPEAFEVLGKEYYASAVFSSGYISATGSEGSNSANARSVYFDASHIRAIQIPLGYKVRFCYYSTTSSSGFISRDDDYQPCGVGVLNYIQGPSGTAYFRMVVVNNNASEINAAARSELDASLLLYSDNGNRANDMALPDLVKKAYNVPLPAGSSTPYFSMVKGSMVTSAGGSSSDNKYARTEILPLSAATFLIDFPTDFAANVSFFTQATFQQSYFISKQLLRYNSAYLIQKPSNAVGVIFEFHRKDWQAISDNDISALTNGFKVFTSPAKTLGAITQNSARAAFVTYMAQMCDKLGMDDSYFANPSGLTAESYTTPADELKLGIAVTGNPLALDIWSTKDRDFTIGGSNRRTVSIANNVYSAQPVSATYKLLGGKGGSLLADAGGGQKRKAHIGLYDVDGYPVIMALLCAGEWVYDNITNCAQELAGMMADAMAGNEVTKGEYITRLLTEGGGYAAVPVPTCAGAYLNSYTADEILSRDNVLHENSSTAQIPASTTKTLTMLCALSVLSDLQETVQLVAGDISSGSGTTFSAGDTVTVEEALRIMMMESSNTMALAIARFVGNKILRADEAKG